MDAIIIEGLKVETVVGCFSMGASDSFSRLMLDLIIATRFEAKLQTSDELDQTRSIMLKFAAIAAQGDSSMLSLN